MLHFNRFNQNGKIQGEIGGSASLTINGRVYHLTGILVHDGPSANSGHYFCDVLLPPYSQTGVAYRCNDSDYPKQISNEMVGTSFKTAYMQIYVLSDELTAVPPPKLIETTTAQDETTVSTESVPYKQPIKPSARRAEKVSQGNDDPSTKTPDIDVQSNESEELAILIAQRESILSIPPAQRTSGDNNRKRKINEKIRRMVPKKPALTSAEKMRAQRQDETKCAKERARRQEKTNHEKERIANTQSKRAQRQDEIKRKEERADDQMRRAAKRANVIINPRAGLNSGLLLSGHFKVEKHFLGLMDKVKLLKLITTYHKCFPRCAQSAEHVISKRRLVAECAV